MKASRTVVVLAAFLASCGSSPVETKNPKAAATADRQADDPSASRSHSTNSPSVAPRASAAGAEGYQPRIGVNAEPDDPSSSQRVVQRITEAGGAAVPLLPKGGTTLDDVDAVVLTGGKDIDPARYGEKPHASTSLISQRRDAFDFALAKDLRSSRMPVLGICLGGQELWVAAGGTLIQDIPSEIGNRVNHRARADLHAIRLVDGTRLQQIYQVDALNVFSNHHQAVDPKRPAAGFIISATSADGVVEGFESKDPSRFVIGTSWHPEHSSEEVVLFKALVEAARSYRTSKEVIGGDGASSH